MVYFNLHGRLGNQLFQYAAALSLGKGKAVGVTSNPRALASIRDAGPLFSGLEIVPQAPEGAMLVRQPNMFGPVEFPEPEGRDLLLDGFFQDERYLDDALVRRAYAIPREMEQRLRARFGAALAQPQVTSIHVRRGDYLKLPQSHPFVGERYFRDAIARLPGCRQFIVCSDDLDWCRRFFPKTFPDRQFEFADGGSPMEDLFLCSLCRNNIMSNSSFSWWGAWLNGHPDKRVIAPSMWFGFALKNYGLDWSGLYFKNVEVVRNGYSPVQWLKARWEHLKYRRAARRERKRRRG